MPFRCDEVALYDLWCSCRTKICRKKKHFTFLFFITTSVLKSSEKHLQICNLAIAAEKVVGGRFGQRMRFRQVPLLY